MSVLKQKQESVLKWWVCIVLILHRYLERGNAVRGKSLRLACRWLSASSAAQTAWNTTSFLWRSLISHAKPTTKQLPTLLMILLLAHNDLLIPLLITLLLLLQWYSTVAAATTAGDNFPTIKLLLVLSYAILLLIVLLLILLFCLTTLSTAGFIQRWNWTWAIHTRHTV